MRHSSVMIDAPRYQPSHFFIGKIAVVGFFKGDAEAFFSLCVHKFE